MKSQESVTKTCQKKKNKRLKSIKKKKIYQELVQYKKKAPKNK